MGRKTSTNNFKGGGDARDEEYETKHVSFSGDDKFLFELRVSMQEDNINNRNAVVNIWSINTKDILKSFNVTVSQFPSICFAQHGMCTLAADYNFMNKKKINIYRHTIETSNTSVSRTSSVSGTFFSTIHFRDRTFE